MLPQDENRTEPVRTQESVRILLDAVSPDVHSTVTSFARTVIAAKAANGTFQSFMHLLLYVAD